MKQRGFTLLELLLVISLIAVMTMVGMSAYQLQMRNFNIDKTSLQMQQWLQAGMSYYVDCNAWPANTALLMGQQPLPSTCGTKAGQLIQYLPAGSDVDGPWNGNKYVVVTAPSSEYFEIQTTLKNLGSRTNAETIGQSIAARLPNAQAHYAQLSQQENVVAQVNIPGQALNVNNNTIVQNIYYRTIGNANPANSVSIPVPQNCPANMQPDIYASLADLTAPGHAANNPAILNYFKISCAQNGGNYSVSAQALGGASEYDYGSQTIMIVTVCEPAGSSAQSCLSSSSTSLSSVPSSSVNALNKF